jgi:UDP-2,3-diacylglucosamine pyrophosphatase LpxH
MHSPNAEEKTIVISDIHMSDGASTGADYSWFRLPCQVDLTAMLNKIAQDSRVGELVLLGDLFDLWLYPINIPPLTVSEIIDLKENAPIIEALRLCVQKKNVYYMNGNHDMAVVASDLQPFSSGGKNIKLISPDEYNKNYLGLRHLEHGHAVDMFNAPDAHPDDPSETIGGYPLGFFITRLIATAGKRWAAARQALQALLHTFGAKHKAMRLEGIDVLSVGSLLVKSIIDLLKVYGGVNDSDKIRFSEPGLDNQYTVGDIKSHYGSLFGTWLFERYPDPEDFVHAMLVGFEPNGLDWYAEKLLSGSGAPKVVVMGHTHQAAPKSYVQGVYDNDGCWCFSSTSGFTHHYVEIVGDTATLLTFP